MKILKWIVLDIVLLFGVAAMAQDKLTPKDPPKTEAKVEASITPTENWLNTYEEYVALVHVIQQVSKESGLDKLEELANQKSAEIGKGIPAGYHFNQVTKKFDKNPEAPKPAEKDKK